MKQRFFILCLLAMMASVGFAQKKEGFKKGIHDYQYADGRVYSGEWKDYQPSGEGKMSYADGSVYTGAFLFGQRSGQGTMQTADGKELTGNWVKDELTGKGVVRYANGNFYEGVLNQGVPNGYGAMRTDAGQVEGNFKDGIPSGRFKIMYHNGNLAAEYDLQDEQHGTIKYANGYVFTGEIEDLARGNKGILTQPHGGKAEGEFKDGELWNGTMTNYRIDDERECTGRIINGKQEGKGTMYFYAGDYLGNKYVGNYKNGQWHGQGTYTWADGRQYNGNFVEDKSCGQGVETQPHGGKAEGEFKDDELWNGTMTNYRTDDEREYTVRIVNGKREGQGTLYFYAGDYQGDKYVGNFKNGQFEGQGTYTWADGRRYVGQWVNDKKCGQGTMTWPNGDKYVGQWADGKRNGQGTLTYGPNQPWIKATGVFRNDAHVSGTLVRTNGTFVGTWNENGNAISVRKIR